MDKLSKKELIDLIVTQQTDLARYKSRFKDLVAAHKGLLREKELLESSLKSITKTNTAKSSSSETSENDPETKEIDSSKSEDETESVEHLKGQLATLMNSLATLSEEKSRMEAAFQADKKQLRSEKMQVENKVKELEGRLETETRSHLSEMEKFKAKLILERHQREKEHNDHGVMIRELQKVVSEERSKREKAETNLESLNSELVIAHKTMQQSKKEASEAKAQLEYLKDKLKNSKLNSGATTEKLQQELEQLKILHIETTMKEQEKIKEAEEKSKRQAAAHEERVANLEARLAELSQTVGLYDRLRQSDQQAIDKLKERLLQLEMEHGEEKSDTGVDDMISSIQNIKRMIEMANKTSEKQIDLKAIMKEILGDNSISDDIHKQCRDDYEQLKNDFDFYKKQFVFAQHPNPASYRVDNGSKESELKSQIKKLKERISNLHHQIDDMEKSRKKEKDEHHQAVLAEKNKFKLKLQALESEWRNKVQTLEVQLAKQRERAMCLVNEKEQDLSDLRESLNTLIPKRLSTDKPSAEGEGVVLHYTEELARRDVELTRLRKDKLLLESELREVRRELVQHVSHEQHLSTLLDQQLERFKQCQSREGANLEYLKNVVFNFLLSSDSSSKCHMLNAIDAVLKFSESEKTKITQCNSWYNKLHTKP